MEWFDAVVHTMTTVSAGGFANYDESFSHPKLTGAIPVSIVFMLIAGLPFTLLSMLLLRGKISLFCAIHRPGSISAC